jgi:hypothetical protein
VGRKAGGSFEFEEPTRDRERPLYLATGSHLSSIARIDNQRIGRLHQIGSFGWRDGRDNSAGGG